MSLTDIQIKDLAKKMKVPLVFCGFKTELAETKLQHNKSYIINMEDEFDEEGNRNEGTHYACFQVNKYPSGKIEKIYFDSFGAGPPQDVQDFIGGKVPFNTKDIQSLMNEACGWYCLAFLHYINAYEGRTKDLYTDCEHFTDLFDDLTKSADHLKNEYILKHFFQSNDPKKRKPVELKGFGAPTDPSAPADPNTIITDVENSQGGLPRGGGIYNVPVDFKYV
jgi:hypothetical protein